MGTELTERLRNRRSFGSMDGGLHWLMLPGQDQDCLDAADEIERLRAALTEIQDYGGVDTGGPSTIRYSAAGHLDCRRIARAALLTAYEQTPAKSEDR